MDHLSFQGEECEPFSVPKELPHIVGQSILFSMCIVFLWMTSNDKMLKEKPKTAYVFSFMVYFILEVCGYHTFQN